MSSARNQQPSTFPAVPPSLSAGDHGMPDYYAAQDTQRPVPHTLPNITPYLGLRARLSQVWINKWTILLLLVLARTLIAIAGLHNDLGSARREALSACSSVESMGSAMASMPHYMSHGVNEMAAHGVEKAVSALMSGLLMTITGLEEIFVFVVNMMTSTYVCLITLAVAGSLHVALQVAKDVSDFLNKTIGDIGKDIHKDIDGFQNDLNKFVGGLNSIPQIFGGKAGAIPTLNVDGSLGKLDHLQMPADIDQGLAKINASIPDFAQVNNFTNNVLRLPFEEVKKLINGSIHFTFDRSIFPVPQKEQLTFCSDNNGISDFFDELGYIADLARKIFLGVLIVLAVLCCIPMGYREIRRWRTIQQRSKLVKDQSQDPLDVIYIASRPYTAAAGITVASTFGSTKKQTLTRWVVAYATSPQALFILSLAVAGLFSCLCQYILLRTIEKEVPALAHQVGDFAGQVVTKLNNASEAWATGTNQVILSTNKDINHDVFGWVNTTTGALNSTLNMFTDEMSKALNVTFGGTILYDPIKEVLNCLIGLKIAGIEKGLTWVSDHAHIDFPLFNNNTFSLAGAAALASPDHNSSKASAFLSDPGNETTDKITSAITRVTDHIADAIHTEALISTTILLIWVSLVLGGLLRALFLAAKRDKIRGEGGATFAGDIPLEDQQQRPMSSAPAYEPPRFATAANPFGDPVQREFTHDDGLGDWHDQKVGFAGERAPAGIERPGHVRGSSYGVLEKRGDF